MADDGLIDCSCCGRRSNHTRVRRAAIADGTHKWVGSICCWPEIAAAKGRGHRGFYVPGEIVMEVTSKTS